MQIIYAAPFVLAAVLAFFTAIAVPKWRPFAIPALIVPIAFAISGIIGWIAFALIGDATKFHFTASTAAVVVEALLFYATPGVLGAWIAVKFFKSIEETLLKTASSRQMLLRIAVATVSAPLGLILANLLLLKVLSEGNVSILLALDAVAAGLTWMIVFGCSGMIKVNWASAEPNNIQ